MSIATPVYNQLLTHRSLAKVFRGMVEVFVIFAWGDRYQLKTWLKLVQKFFMIV